MVVHGRFAESAVQQSDQFSSEETHSEKREPRRNVRRARAAVKRQRKLVKSEKGEKEES